MSKIKLLKGNNIELLKTLPENSIDSIVTDPPYGLSFMGKKWDYDVPSIEFWKEAYRVLKPGGHILSFGGTRTYHRMVVNIEDAGFEIRDQIMWLYGSGFPKSLNIGKAVDKLEGNDREVVGDNPNKRDSRSSIVNVQTNECKITKGNSDWEGWGTALKPSNEPICLARKPLSEKTIADNVLKWKTGGLNIDGCRVGNETIMTNMKNTKGGLYNLGNEDRTNEVENTFNEGRFPANIILDEEAGIVLDKQSGISKSTDKKTTTPKIKGWGQNQEYTDNVDGRGGFGDKGGASRFFYQAKVGKKERNMGLEAFEDKKVCQGGYEGDWSSDKEGDIGINKVKIYKNNHPTVKPVSLMSYLCKLVTPPGGIVLDPFMGSGSTGIAAQLQGFRFCGMEMDGDYFKIAEARINDYEKYREFLKGK
jgi:site-specific DNA-methyltransferase (adenine-specific)